MLQRAADHQRFSVQEGSSLPAATRPTPGRSTCEFPKKALGMTPESHLADWRDARADVPIPKE